MHKLMSVTHEFGKQTALLCALGVAILGTGGQAAAAPRETGFLNRSTVVDDAQRRYQVYVPRNYTPQAKWPVVLFLHGINERGSDGLQPTQEGIGRAIRLQPEQWPAIVVFPQCPDDALWMGATTNIAMAALDEVLEEFATDPARVYLTGLSLGGNGTWYLGYKYPERFAALVPIAGWVKGSERQGIPSIPEGDENPHATVAEVLTKTPVWIVHGDADAAVSVTESRQMHAELSARGAPVIYSELHGVGHNSWDSAYANAELIRWMFSQQRAR